MERLEIEADLQAYRENEIIEAAKRLEEAKKVSPEAIESIEKARSQETPSRQYVAHDPIADQPDENFELLNLINDPSKRLLVDMANVETGGLLIGETKERRYAILGSQELVKPGSNREWINFETVLKNLSQLELITETKNNYFEVTSKGFEMADLIKAGNLV